SVYVIKWRHFPRQFMSQFALFFEYFFRHGAMGLRVYRVKGGCPKRRYGAAIITMGFYCNQSLTIELQDLHLHCRIHPGIKSIKHLSCINSITNALENIGVQCAIAIHNTRVNSKDEAC